MGHPVLTGAGGVGTGKRALDVRRLVIHLSGHICKGGTGSGAAVQVLLFFFFINFISHSILVIQSCLTLCNPVDCSTPGLPVCHHLPEFTQTYVHWVGDAIQPTISSSVFPFSTCLQSFPASGYFSADTKIVTLTENNARVFSGNKINQQLTNDHEQLKYIEDWETHKKIVHALKSYSSDKKILLKSLTKFYDNSKILHDISNSKLWRLKKPNLSKKTVSHRW